MLEWIRERKKDTDRERQTERKRLRVIMKDTIETKCKREK
jgi:hypothetical protein